MVLGRLKGACDLALLALHKEMFNSNITGGNSYGTLCIFEKLCDLKKKIWCFREKEVNFLVSENFSSLVVIQTFCHNFSTILHSKPQCTNVSIALHLYIFCVWKNMKLKRIHVNVLSVCVQMMMLCIWRQSIYACWAY